MYELIDRLKQKQWLWQGSDTPTSSNRFPTGFELLDRKLDGGLPARGVVEIQSQSGIGELRLLLPHIKAHSQQRLAVFIQPPGCLSAEMLHASGLDLEQLLMITPTDSKQALWAAEQCLKSGACANVLLWHPELEVHQARRLQVASEQGDCLQFLFKSERANSFSLPVSLSLTLQPHAQGLEVTITKRKGGWSHGRFVIEMSHLWPGLTLNRPEPVVLPFQLQQQG
ncbi:translesion DNA synthesis-associated protein ImuA [Vibrio sp.]|uniref:translesion DNA synthesis-associated protein ImuA n=1 Tax=Vibrio sp. TaxID=678 RepID=UPI003D0A08C0